MAGIAADEWGYDNTPSSDVSPLPARPPRKSGKISKSGDDATGTENDESQNEENIEIPESLPDESLLQAEVAKLESIANGDSSKLADLRASLRDKDELRRAMRQEIDVARQRVEELKQQIKSKLDEKNEYLPRLQQRDAQKRDLFKLRKELPFTSVVELDQAVANLEFELSHSTLSLKEEKDMIAKIKKIKTMKDQVRGYELQAEALSKAEEGIQDCEIIVKEKNEELKVLFARDQEEMKTLRELRDKEKEVTNEIKTLRETVDNTRKKVDDTYGKIRKLRSDHRQKVNLFYKHRREVRTSNIRSSTPPKADTSGIEEYLRKQRERLASAGVKWDSGDTSPTVPVPVKEIKETLKSPEAPEKPATPSKVPNGKATVPAGPVVEEKTKDSGFEQAEQRRGKKVASLPEDEDVSAASAPEVPDVGGASYDAEAEKLREEEDQQKRLEKIAKQRAEAEEKRKKREEMKQKKELARAAWEKAEKERKREERKLKKLKKKEAQILANQDASSEEENVETAGTGDEKKVDSNAEEGEVVGKLGKKGVSIKERQTVAQLESQRGKQIVEQKLKLKRRAKIPVLGLPVPKLTNTHVLIISALVVLLAVLGAFLVKRQSVFSPSVVDGTLGADTVSDAGLQDGAEV